MKRTAAAALAAIGLVMLGAVATPTSAQAQLPAKPYDSSAIQGRATAQTGITGIIARRNGGRITLAFQYSQALAGNSAAVLMIDGRKGSSPVQLTATSIARRVITFSMPDGALRLFEGRIVPMLTLSATNGAAPLGDFPSSSSERSLMTAFAYGIGALAFGTNGDSRISDGTATIRYLA